MHDLDRTLLELPDPSMAEADEFDPEASLGGDLHAESDLNEMEELELASEAVGLTEEAELEYFLGKLVSRVARKAGRVLKGPAGGALVGILKNVARRALPLAGSALGTMVGGPLGTAIGGKLASQAGSMLGLELEGLSPQDQEFESAKQFVRLASSAAQNLLNNANAGGAPAQAAAQAVATAARTYAPGLLNRGGKGQGQSGRWVRRGRTIVLYGV